MKTLSFFVITFTLALLHAQSAEELPACCRELPAATKLTDASLYQLESRWTSDLGKKIELSAFHGRPQIVAMFFTSCDYACPILTLDIKRILERIPEDTRDDIGVLMISMDTDRDTPEVLHAFREKWALPAETCALIRGSSEDVREIAALLGVNYRKDTNGNYAHSNLLTLLNAEGEVAYQQPGLNKSPDGFLAEIAKLTNR